MSIPLDVKEFLENYPDNDDDPKASVNLEFYSNLRRCRPDNRLIDEIHEQCGFVLLTHGPFPIQEHGMNYASQPLLRHEIEAMKADSTILNRIATSYKMMLDFYGMRLISLDSGLVDRALPPRNYASRYKNLSSMDRWWANCLRDEGKRNRVGDLIRKVRGGEDGFVFTRDMYRDELRLGVPSSDPEVTLDEAIDASGGAVGAESLMKGVEKPMEAEKAAETTTEDSEGGTI
ncbi:hypothetical protein DXG01_011959 [Tephrocybe rancida]|nr:hypothetical protein DXG01_011959 [Tephrocybe rancida]